MSNNLYDTAAEAGRGESPAPRLGDPQQRRRQFRMRTVMLVIALVAVWMGVLLDPHIGPLVLLLVGAIAIGTAVMGVAMALGLLGFGLVAAGGRLAGWLRRAARWPDE
jgi:fatty acid desaturase